MRERFPPITFVTSLVLVALVASFFRYVQGQLPFWSWWDLLTAFGVWAQFLMLRVLDEHKDFANDQKFHPERALQRGLISLDKLKKLGVAAFVVTIAVTIARGGTMITWAAMQFWTILMTYEFFCPEYLRKRLFLYSVSHLFVLPLMIVWIYGMSVTPEPGMIWDIVALMAFTFVNGLIYEVARKSKGSEEETPGEITFSQSWGVDRAALALSSLMIFSFVLFAAIGITTFQLTWKECLPAFATLLMSLAGINKFRQSPSKKSRKMVEGASGLYVLCAYLAYICFVQFGL